jgi:hypothetical protein
VRLVGLRDERTDEYHLYVTNIPPDKLAPEDIASTYAARWLIELAFRELKSQYRADQMPSRKRHIVEALLLAAFIVFLVSRSLRDLVSRSLNAKLRPRLRDERWAAVFTSVVSDLLAIVVRPPRYARMAEPFLVAAIRKEAIDPNRLRLSLIQRAQAGVGYGGTLC